VLNQYYKVSTEFERLGDQAVNIANIASKLSENNTGFRLQHKSRGMGV
jgi:phosphate:Na+ symporter